MMWLAVGMLACIVGLGVAIIAWNSSEPKRNDWDRRAAKAWRNRRAKR